MTSREFRQLKLGDYVRASISLTDDMDDDLVGEGYVQKLARDTVFINGLGWHFAHVYRADPMIQNTFHIALIPGDGVFVRQLYTWLTKQSRGVEIFV